MATITREEISNLVREELTHLLRCVPSFRHEVIGIMSEVFAQRADLQAVLERIDAQGERIEALRADFNRRMGELAQRQEEHSHRMEEFAQRQEEHSERLQEHSREIVALRKDFNRGFAQLSRRISRMESTLGGLGACWGMMSESAFREGLAGILTEETGLRVEHYLRMETEGVAFGRPRPIEIDVIIRDEEPTLLERKSSVSWNDVDAFGKKAAFYEQAEGVEVKRKIIISPMFEPEAEALAQELEMETYTSAYGVQL